jgi:hypothetical protein
MNNPLGVLMRWMAETVHTSDYLNEWAYMLYDLETVELLLKRVWQQVIAIFG